jgi:hypothetical protein
MTERIFTAGRYKSRKKPFREHSRRLFAEYRAKIFP